MLFGLLLPQHGQAGAVFEDDAVAFCVGLREQHAHADGGIQVLQDIPSLNHIFITGPAGTRNAPEPGGGRKQFPVKVFLEALQRHFPHRHAPPRAP